MQNIEIKLPATMNLSKAEKAIDAALTANGLEIALRGTLKKIPGCIHWHARNPGQSGTLELTLWPRQRRVWITIQSGRDADWIAVRLPAVKKTLHQHLKTP
jgi:hypothetical protein